LEKLKYYNSREGKIEIHSNFSNIYRLSKKGKSKNNREYIWLYALAAPLGMVFYYIFKENSVYFSIISAIVILIPVLFAFNSALFSYDLSIIKSLEKESGTKLFIK
jgi:uncharacterized membrane protein YgaE (UPF0421/DUF939 family)